MSNKFIVDCNILLNFKLIVELVEHVKMEIISKKVNYLLRRKKKKKMILGKYLTYYSNGPEELKRLRINGG